LKSRKTSPTVGSNKTAIVDVSEMTEPVKEGALSFGLLLAYLHSEAKAKWRAETLKAPRVLRFFQKGSTVGVKVLLYMHQFPAAPPSLCGIG
jgi:hypothetical protein